MKGDQYTKQQVKKVQQENSKKEKEKVKNLSVAVLVLLSAICANGIVDTVLLAILLTR